MVCYCGGLTASLVKQAAFDDRPPVSLMQSTLYNGGGNNAALPAGSQTVTLFIYRGNCDCIANGPINFLAA